MAKPKLNEEEQEEVTEMVTDLEQVKKALQICLDFEKEKNIRLINPKGRRLFSEIYRKEEPRRKLEQMIDAKLDARLDAKMIDARIDQVNKKMDILLGLLLKDKPEKDTAETEDMDNFQKMKKKIDGL